MRIFGIDPGSDRTGYGCVESDGSRHHLVSCGALTSPAKTPFPARLLAIYDGLAALLEQHRPDCVAIEDVFHARNVRSALTLGQARGAALVAATRAGVPVAAYAPAAIKRAVVGYGRADKHQIQRMIGLLLELDAPPTPHDAADALAVAICHLHQVTGRARLSGRTGRGTGPSTTPTLPRRWRDYRPQL
ncbi:MAG TPA: crossover junction endodeoxyribonuclease RuvC [Vicinamibacterales bacterium]|jgi:crossover junction endodeoxyribonuclease RuvC|nr:crossover junction endodeoxyribonuclease RuvC [Vicinamibacterales bacterium]